MNSMPAHILLCLGLKLVASQPAVACDHWAFSLIGGRVVLLLLLRWTISAWESGYGVGPAGCCISSKAEAAGRIG